MNQRMFAKLVRDDMIANSTWSKVAEFCFYNNGILSYRIYQENDYYTQIDIVTEDLLNDRERPVIILTSEKVYYSSYSVCVSGPNDVDEVLYSIEYTPLLNNQ
tara:strand:- start:1388 stop:1696 length:309 start_codon:yes stop_codon:yes gene_type:complete